MPAQKTDDPSREQIDAFVDSLPFSREFDEMDREQAIWWFANDYHGGQSSNLYSVLSSSEYRPGRLEDGPEDETTAADIYDALAEEFGGNEE